jgi:hypothetical protein
MPATVYYRPGLCYPANVYAEFRHCLAARLPVRCIVGEWAVRDLIEREPRVEWDAQGGCDV